MLNKLHILTPIAAVLAMSFAGAAYATEMPVSSAVMEGAKTADVMHDAAQKAHDEKHGTKLVKDGMKDMKSEAADKAAKMVDGAVGAK